MKRASWALLLAFVASVVTVLHAPPPAVACSCVSADPIDSAAGAEVVFTGIPGPNLGTDNKPVWSFTVDGVVKGDVASRVEVDGDDWMSGCGNDFGHITQSIVVYAARKGDRLYAGACTPIVTREAFEEMIAGIRLPTGQGPPAAVLSGTIGTSDLALLDAYGRTLAMGAIGNGGVLAHCAGTATVAVAASWPNREVLLVDLTTMTVTGRRRLKTDFLSITGDLVGCLFGGRLVVTSAGFGPDTGTVTVAVSHAAPKTDDDVTQSFTGISRAEIHPAGTVLLLPTTVGAPLQVLRAEDLSDVAEVGLLPGISTIDGAVSPDGTLLAMLVTVSGTEVAYDTGATHVVTLGLRDGIPDDSPPVLTELSPAEGAGRARWIGWLDDSTWMIERETDDTKRLELVNTTGSMVLESTDIGWGWGMVATAEGMLRARGGGVELVGRDGTILPGDPAPPDQYVDRFLALTPLVDMPTVTFDVPPIELLTIRRPTPAAAVSTTTTDIPTTSGATLGDGAIGSGASPGGATPGDEKSVPVIAVVALLAGALAVVVVVVILAVRRRTRPAH